MFNIYESAPTKRGLVGERGNIWEKHKFYKESGDNS